MKRVKIKKIAMPDDIETYSHLALIRKGKKKGILYHDGVLLGEVKNYSKAKKYIFNHFLLYNASCDFDDKSFASWVREKGDGHGVYVWSKALTKEEIYSVYINTAR